MTTSVPALTLRNIREAWDEVRPALEGLSREPFVEWRPEDMYALCLDDAALYTAPDGFVILQPVHNPRTLKLEVEIIAAHFPSAAAQEVYLPQVVELAREAGAHRIVMSTSRRGFERDARWTRLETRFQLLVPGER